MAANAREQQPRLRKKRLLLFAVFCCVLLCASLGYLRVFSSSKLGSDESHKHQNRQTNSQRVHTWEMKKEHHEHTASHEWVGNEATTKPITTTTVVASSSQDSETTSASEPSTSCTVEDHLLGASTEKRKQLFGDKTKK